MLRLGNLIWLFIIVVSSHSKDVSSDGREDPREPNEFSKNNNFEPMDTLDKKSPFKVQLDINISKMNISMKSNSYMEKFQPVVKPGEPGPSVASEGRSAASQSQSSRGMTCDACKMLVAVIRMMVAEQKTTEDIIEAAIVICKAFKIEDDRVCDMVVRQYHVRLSDFSHSILFYF